MSNEKNIVSIEKNLDTEIYNVENIKNLIYTIRGRQVILDADIAYLYEVETKRINEAVKRNIKRFPEEFCFQLSEEEYNSLRSQIATLKENDTNSLRSQFVILKEQGRGQHRKYLPYAFTEQGIAMLSAVLRSDKAIEVSINIMNAFVEMKRFITNNQMLFEKISNIELKQIQYQNTTNEKFEKVFKYIGEHKEENQKIFFDGQIYDAFSMIINLIQKANNEIILIDNYVDIETLNILSKKKDRCNVRIYTQKNIKLTSSDIKKFNSQYPKLEIKFTNKFHDRFLIIDQNCIYHIGASIKDAGKKCFGITLIKYEAIMKDILSKL